MTSEGKSKWRGSYAKFSPATSKYVSGACPNRLAIECTRARAVDHAKFKTTKIYSQGILVNYTKICTNENFPLYGIRGQLLFEGGYYSRAATI